MTAYLGYIEKKGYEPSTYFNYKPVYEIQGSSLIELTSEDRNRLLPNSENEDINFFYQFNNAEQRTFMDKHFSDNQLIVFEFETNDLLDNLNLREERFRTGYKIITYDMWDAGKIRDINSEGFYQLIKKDEIGSDFYKENIVEINALGLKVGSEVMLELGNEYYVGPYPVAYREIDHAFYIRPKIKDSKYTIKGYKISDCVRQEFSFFDGYRGSQNDKRYIVSPQKNVDIEILDVISDAILIDSFKESIANECIENGRINVSDIDKLLSFYEDSVLTGQEITKAIRSNRLNKLVEIITSEADLDDTLSLIAESLCSLIIKYQDAHNVDELIRNILDKYPDFFEHLQGSRIIREQIAKLEKELDDLQQEKVAIADEVEEIRKRSESIEQTALEQKTKEILIMDEEYTQKKIELDEVLKRLKLTDSILNLTNRHEEIKRELDYDETHKKRLENDSKNLETEFLARINNHHDRMVAIAFDGFMSNKMLKAAAQWEAGEAERSYIEAVEAVNSINTIAKETDKLIEYLCNIIQLARPQYNRNTIINIAICISQGFLTVFSGEPGCGKTSICNIVADVLGLNKIQRTPPCDGLVDSLSRYIPVSVERGWTSKRDLVGYYNPLSKTFDKSNRRIYDALKLLDIEQSKNILKYPFIILLDEANLSPMEYYWADFMKICDDLDISDDLGENNSINLGEGNVFSIPETLHFVATINNDHTTETLSPRLIDRAWVITLPQLSTLTVGTKIPPELVEIISWESIKKAFVPENGFNSVMSPEIQKIYDSTLIPHLKKARIFISPRTTIAIKKYWSVGSKRLYNDEYGNDASIVALDYAIAQKILPKISGNGEDFFTWLDEFRNICSSNNLENCASILKDIIARGNLQMKYYQFFS